ncbi:MAG: transglutaminase domain-containing protein [Candidatus Cloacimonetes bacterium]|nr:transglutaminase domain-containing protein [Candidatus Cloacimonadota bacterium]
MRKTTLFSIIVFIFIFAVCSSAYGIELLKGKTLYMQAQSLEKNADYFKAQDRYKEARQELLKEGDIELANQCRVACTRLEKILLTYTHTEADVRKMIKEKYPETTGERIDEVVADGRLAHIEIGGKTYYFDEFLNTLYHIYPDFMSVEAKGALGKMGTIFEIMSPYIYEDENLPSWQTLSSPLIFEFDACLSIPREKFPDEGLLNVWMPLPLSNSSQTNIKIESICSKEYTPYPAQLDGDIGYVYYEFPLEEITDSIRIGTKFTYTAYEVRFNVDPVIVGEYDKNSELYKRYTASDKNIAITPEIRDAARRIAGDETNPYLIAKKFYDHIVYDLDYSYMPHLALEALKIPESVFVHEHGYGDCGAQSMYFSALCRSVGIPARASGGMQLFPLSAAHCGDHFWAHIYIPNSGWIPVDTSVGQAAKYIITLSKEQQTDFIEYFFSKIDPFRYLIQEDVDMTLYPTPKEPLLFDMVLQAPTAECMEMDENPGLLFMESWKIRCKEVSKP